MAGGCLNRKSHVFGILLLNKFIISQLKPFTIFLFSKSLILILILQFGHEINFLRFNLILIHYKS